MARTTRPPAIVLPLLALFALMLAGCGSGGSTSFRYRPPKADRASPPANLFPAAAGMSLSQILSSTDGPLMGRHLRVEPAAMVFRRGTNRYPVVITTKELAPVDDVDIAFYIAKSHKSTDEARAGAAAANRPALESRARGPFPAKVTTLATAPRFVAKSTSQDPRSATVVYVATIKFPSDGKWRVGAVVRDDGKSYSTTLAGVSVGEFHQVPEVGQRAPMIRTPIARSTRDALAISTRRPPDTMNEVDFASALGREPVVLIFASPLYSWNGTAGPMVDVAEQVRRQFVGRATFINMEIYNNNDPAEHPRPQVRAYHLPSQPWVFAVARDGRVAGEAEGAVGVGELSRLAQQAVEG